MGKLTQIWGERSGENLFGEAHESPKYMIFGTSGVFWRRSAGVVLECRITVCNYSVELSIQKSQPSTVVTTQLLCVLSSSRLMFFSHFLSKHSWATCAI